GAGAPLSFKSLDQDIDSRTSLVRVSRDTAGLATSYEYDRLGRLVWSMPGAGQGGWTETVYTPATSAAALANVLVRRRGNGSKSSSVLSQSQIFFDSLGRVWREQRRLP